MAQFGSPAGIGFASAKLLAKAGAKIFITSTTDRIFEREEYLKYANSLRRKEAKKSGLKKDRIDGLADKEEFLLSVTENGFGKRSSSYEYRKTKRGGQGIINIETSERNGGVVASFPVQNDEEVIMVTNRGKLIRLGVKGIRIAGRVTQGVTLLNTEKSEKVVSVTTVKKNEVE